MANERLRTALLQRGLTPSALADTVGVDPKTIERWIGGRIPYRRHRHRVAVRLGVNETYLWPGALAAEQVASASESEILVVYPHRWAVPRDTWGLRPAPGTPADLGRGATVGSISMVTLLQQCDLRPASDQLPWVPPTKG